MSRVSDEAATRVLDDPDLYMGIYRQMLVIRGFEELVQSLFLKGEVDVVADGDRHTLRPGDVFWTGTGCVHAFYETQGGRVRWLETSAPAPPLRHSYRFERDWTYLAERLASDASVGVA